jgi:hypothetical protein
MVDSGNTATMVNNGNTAKMVDSGNAAIMVDSGNTAIMVDSGNAAIMVDSGNTATVIPLNLERSNTAIEFLAAGHGNRCVYNTSYFFFFELFLIKFQTLACSAPPLDLAFTHGNAHLDQRGIYVSV